MKLHKAGREEEGEVTEALSQSVCDFRMFSMYLTLRLLCGHPLKAAVGHGCPQLSVLCTYNTVGRYLWN